MAVYFDNYELTSLFDCDEPSIDVFSQSVSYDGKIAAMTGRPTSAYREPIEISFRVQPKARDRKEQLEAYSQLSAWLDTMETKLLVMTDEYEDRGFMAIPKGRVTPNRGIETMTSRLTFVALVPFWQECEGNRFGQWALKTRTATLTSDGTIHSSSSEIGYYADIENPGNAETPFTLYGSSFTGTTRLASGRNVVSFGKGPAGASPSTAYLARTNAICVDIDSTTAKGIYIDGQTGQITAGSTGTYYINQYYDTLSGVFFDLPVGNSRFFCGAKSAGSSVQIRWVSRWYV